MRDIPQPEGRLKNKDIGVDKPGRSLDSSGRRHAFTNEQEPTAHVSEQFAKQLSELLESGRVQHRYSKLVLVAKPRFLGNLRAALTPQTAAFVTATLDKDLGGVEVHAMPKYLNGVVQI